MKNLRKSIIFILIICFTIMLAACSSDSGNPGMNNDGVKDKKVGYQLEEPAKGDEIAVIHIKIGDAEPEDVHIRFFPEAAPLAVENFKKHAKSGYYKDLIFHRIIEDFCIQGGDPDGTGEGGKSAFEDKEKFEDEFTDKVFNIRGSLAMANAGVNGNGSQFFFNMSVPDKMQSAESIKQSQEKAAKQYEENKDYFQSLETPLDLTGVAINTFGVPPYAIPDDVYDLYKQNGGALTLDGAWRGNGGHTVFAQVFKGMEVLEKINKVEVNASGKPDKDVVITGIDIVKY